jgi:hypothetical protein
MVLPGGLAFIPAGLAMAAMLHNDEIEVDTRLDAPPRMRAVLEVALDRMAEVSEDAYYSLCGRLDTLEHLQNVLLATAAAAVAAAERDTGGSSA